MRPRVIPILLLEGDHLVKTRKFSNATYVGDPINAVRLFNEKGADELVLLDIGRREGEPPNLALVEEAASEAFMPITYGGGIWTADQASAVLKAGVEKVALGRSLMSNPALARHIAETHGSQAVVGCLDVKRTRFAKEVVAQSGGKAAPGAVVEVARQIEAAGCGEIVLTSINREGTKAGYDLDLIARVSASVQIPVVAHGGAGGLEHFPEAIKAGAAAVAAGTLFIFHGKHDAVLITYPEDAKLRALFSPH